MGTKRDDLSSLLTPEETINGKNPVVLKEMEEEDYQYKEAMKTLRTNIQFSGNNIRTIMLTSSLPNEGKSDINFHLAASMAQLGKKVLLIDADIRKSVFVARHQPDRKVDGLSQYLSGQKEMEEVIYTTSVPNLDIVFAGPFSPNPAELLEGTLFQTLLSKSREEYDYIFIDTPPMGSLIDGAVVAQYCDGAVLVIESGTISYHILQRVKGQLEKTGCRIMGVILNKVDVNQASYHYGKYGKYKKYGGYGSYGEYGQNEEPGKNKKTAGVE